MCNNTFSLTHLTKEFSNKFIQNGLTEEEVSKHFDTSQLNKNFAKFGNNVNSHIFTKLFTEVSDSFKGEYFKLDLEKVIEIIESQKNTVNLLHDNFSRKIWKSYLESIVLHYFNCLLIACTKFSKSNVNKFQ